MPRHSFKLKLKPGVAAEYQKRHDEIWPELAADHSAAGLPPSPVMPKWWACLAPLMETNPDFSPVATPLRAGFRLD